MRHVDGLGDRAADERLRSRHHADVRLNGQKPLPELAAFAGTIEDRVIFLLQVGRPFNRHGAADMSIGLGNLIAAEPQRGQQVEMRPGELFGR